MSNRRNSYNAVIDAVFVPNPHFPNTVLYSKGQTKVYLFRTPEPLVVRVVTGSHDSNVLQREILLAVDHDVIAQILHSETRQIGDERVSIQVQTYLAGSPLDHYPTDDEARALAEMTHILHQRLCAISNAFTDKGIPSLGDISRGLVAAVGDCSMKKEALQLFANSRYKELVSKETQVLTYGDPWPQNYLFDDSTERSKVSIADIDPMLFGPKALQPAMLFSAYFVISFLTFAEGDQLPLSLDALIGLWPEPIDRDDVLLLMQVYPILLSMQKTLMFSGTSESDQLAHQSNLSLLERCLEMTRQLS